MASERMIPKALRIEFRLERDPRTIALIAILGFRSGLSAGDRQPEIIPIDERPALGHGDAGATAVLKRHIAGVNGNFNCRNFRYGLELLLGPRR